MTSPSWTFDNVPQPRSTSEVMKDHRARVALEEQEKAERRRMQCAELRLDVSSPETRIRAWEKLYELRLPTDENHPVLDVIALSTHLTLEQVREEQHARAARRLFGFSSAASLDRGNTKP